MVNGLFSCCGLGGKPTEPSDDDEYESTCELYYNRLIISIANLD